MRFLVAAVIASLSVVSAKTHQKHFQQPHTEKELETLFTSFVKTHEKKYTHDEFFSRFNTFKNNMEKIRIHNNSGARWTMGANQYADLTHEEFKAARLGFNKVDNSYMRARNEVTLSTNNVAASVDWRTKGIVTPVKDQGQCGSCWAFSTTGSVEGAYAQSEGTLISLSEQQLVDCSSSYGNLGCNGGLMDSAFEYIIDNGIGTEASYPYVSPKSSSCKKVTSAVSISGYTDVPAGNEDQLLAAVNKQPVSVAIEADQEAFQFYSGGVLTAACGSNLDHGVLAVGYGTDNNVDYWIIKNSWGASWGEAGYIRLERGIDQCGLADMASYPKV